jgi:hypothetical protein
MIGKLIIGLAAVATVSAATAMSASAEQKQKNVTATIPKQVCETLTVDTQNWGKQTVQVCGPPGPRGQAKLKLQSTQHK